MQERMKVYLFKSVGVGMNDNLHVSLFIYTQFYTHSET